MAGLVEGPKIIKGQLFLRISIFSFPVFLAVVVVSFIFRILVHYETFFTRAQGPVIVIAKEEI